MISVNQQAARIVEEMIAHAEQLGIAVTYLSCGARLVDLGLTAPGGLSAGKYAAEDQEAEMEFSTELVEAISGLFKRAVIEMVEQQPDSKIGDLEQGLRHLLKRVGGQALSEGLSAVDQKYPEREVGCACGKMAGYQFRRKAKTLTVFGWVEYRRAYYLCNQCHQGQYPLDQRFGLQPGQVSAGLAPLLALAGVETAFEEGCELVERFLLLEVSDNTLRKETQIFGQLQVQHEQAWQARSQDPQHLQERQQSAVERPQRLYGSLDGALVPIGEEWRELKTGSWYEVEQVGNACSSGVGQVDELRARHISYYCDIADVQAFEALVWASAVQRNANEWFIYRACALGNCLERACQYRYWQRY